MASRQLSQVIATIAEHQYFANFINRMRWFTVGALSLGSIVIGISMLVGPDTSTRPGVVFQLIEDIGVPSEILGSLVITGGVAILWRQVSMVGYALIGLVFAWWAIATVYVAVFLNVSATFTTAGMSTTLALLSFIALYGGLRIRKFVQELARVRDREGGRDG